VPEKASSRQAASEGPRNTEPNKAEPHREPPGSPEEKLTSGTPSPRQKATDHEPKKPEAKNHGPSVAKRLRLEQVRQLLADAERASEKGKHLDAVLGFGQAAVLYPQELAEVENPERVRRKFIDALKRYQAEVERALQRANEQMHRDR
jgi:hypothetical protein